MKENTKDCNRDFTLLNLEHIKKRFNFKDIKLINNKLYISSQQDEWYIEYVDYLDALILHHKNTRNITRRYHREKKRFVNIFQIFGYIRHHDNKIFNNTRRYESWNKRLDKLFEQI